MEYIPNKPTPILIVDDDTGFLLTAKAILIKAGMGEPALVSDSRRVLGLLDRYSFQFVLIDMVMPEIDGLALLQQIKNSNADVECVMVTILDDTSSAVQAIKCGAFDYLVKPVNAGKLVITINRALERFCLRHKLSLYEKKQSLASLKNPEAFKDIIAVDDVMIRVFHQVEIAAPTCYSVIITGETGTGKEMIAQTIHRLSNRAEKPFIPVNMGAVSGTLFKDEFFGHARGAYTGAANERKGFIEAAQGGTLFMDEITDLGRVQQGVLLRVLQEKEFYPLGSTKSRVADIRIVTASNQSIEEEIRRDCFRADLFHRLNMFHIHLPPLRERTADILPLARYFLKRYAVQVGKNIQDLTPDFIKRLAVHPFPGNVRELENIIASAVIQEEGSLLSSASLSDHHTSPSSVMPKTFPEFKTLIEVEAAYIQEILSETEGNRTQAARILGIGRRTLQRRLKTIK